MCRREGMCACGGGEEEEGNGKHVCVDRGSACEGRKV